MTPRWTLGALLTCSAAAAAVCVVRAQQPPTPTFRSGVDIVVVEAHVSDKGGAIAKGLTAADLQVPLRGKSRPVVTAELVEYEDAPAIPLPPNPDISTNVVSAGASRTILLVVDQASLRPEGLNVLVAAKTWVSKLGPADRVGLVTLPTGP